MNDTQPNQFITSTDFPNLLNDSRVGGNIIIPGSIVIPGGSEASGALNFTSGDIGSLSRGRIASTKNFTNWYVGQIIGFERVGTVGGTPTPYTIYAFFYRTAPTTLTAQVFLPNINAGALTCEAGSETIYFYSNQFIAPYA